MNLSNRLFAAVTLLAAAACSPPPAQPPADSAAQNDVVSSGDGSSPDASEPVDAAVEDAPAEDVVLADGAARDPLVVARPYRVRAPAAGAPVPLVVLLHGYGANGLAQDTYFGLGQLVPTRRFVLATPDGTLDASNRRFWNATDACCDFARTGVDDVAYIRAIIDDAKARYAIDPNRVYVIGHSNGGFMALRIACELSDRVAAVMSLAGAGFSDATRCRPSQPVHVLQVHGTLDATIQYNGGSFPSVGSYPGAERTVSDWAMRNGCGAMRQSAGAPMDLESTLAGPETTRQAHAECRAGGSAELWTIQGGAHIPTFAPEWATSVIDWLFAHGRTG